jgi:pimeloyl-ACP methyl ester carboxylesterase
MQWYLRCQTDSILLAFNERYSHSPFYRTQVLHSISTPSRNSSQNWEMAQQFTLPGGRKIDYFVSGTIDGFPLVWQHSTPGSHVPVPCLEALCKAKGIKLITYSRPGYGGSSRDKGRQVVSCVGDVKALNAHLGLRRCLVGGWSGGGEYNINVTAKT